MLGYRPHFMRATDDLESLLKRHDALTHTPVAARYVELDARFPGSQFILTTRDRESWLRSCEQRWSLPGGKQTPQARELYRRLYGVDHFDRAAFSAAYDRHVTGVRRHFEERPNQLLEMDIVAGEGFEVLCPFLGKPLRDDPMPHKNTIQEHRGPIARVRRMLRAVLPKRPSGRADRSW
jgi:hypothetical protein